MGKRSAVGELFLGNMGSIQRETRPSIQREDQPTMETKLEQIAASAVNHLSKSVVRQIRTLRSVGAGGGRLPPATRWARSNPRPYRDHQRALNFLAPWISTPIKARFTPCAFCSLKGRGSPPARSQDDSVRSGTRSRFSRR